MGYQMKNGQWANTKALTAAPLAVRTSNGNGDAIEVGQYGGLRLTLKVEASAGTNPTLDVVVESSEDGSTNWQPCITYGPKTTTGSERQVFVADRWVRVRWTIGGTNPVFTFSVSGEAF